MAAYQSLGQELECPICLDFPKDPKVMGQCLHAACLDCLEKLVANRNADSFLCPVCREKCMIPQKGVGELKDDFRLRAIIEQFQKIKAEKSVMSCTACPSPASHFCDDCDKIFLCISCSRKHSRNPFTAAHELVGICSKHGKRLTMFCRKCGTAICSVCLIADHPSDSQEHDVIHLQDVVTEETAEVVTALEKLKRTREQKEHALGKIIEIRDRVVATMNSDLIQLGQKSDDAAKHTHQNHSELKAESCDIQAQIDALTKRKKAVDEEIAQTGEKETSLHHEKEKFAKCLHHNRDQCMKEFVEAIKQAAAENDRIKEMLDLGRQQTILKPVIDAQTVPSLLKLKEEVVKAIVAADQVDRVSPFLGAEENIVRFVPNSTPMEIGVLQRGSTQPTMMELGHFAARVFATLNKIADLSYPSDRPCKSLYSIRHLPDGRLASFYRSGDDISQRADTISLHDPVSPDVPVLVIDKNIQPGVDMTVTSMGELMVLRLPTRPILSVRVFLNREVFQDINLKVSPTQIREVHPIETDEAGNIFVGNLMNHLHVFHPNGWKHQSVKPYTGGFGKYLGMSYYKQTRTLYIANGLKILMFHWDGNSLKKISPCAHGVDGFGCSDVCISNDGEIFAAGVMDGNREIRAYQLKVVESERLFQKKHAASSTGSAELRASGSGVGQEDRYEWIRLNFGDNVCRTYPFGWQSIAWITVFGDRLALGYHNKVELFQLIP